MGPVSPRRLDFEYQRLVEVWERIREPGYRRSDGADGDLGGQPLHQSDGEVRVMISPEHHRIAALAALGYDTVQGPIIRRDDCAGWPHVRAGLYTVDQARMLFDRLFSRGGNRPRGR